jgi:hypothetical protein
MSLAPKINYNQMVPSELEAVLAERDRAQQACQQMGEQIAKLEQCILAALAVIETQSEPDIDVLHDVLAHGLKKSG